MCPQPWSENGAGILMVGEEGDKVVMGDTAGLWETVHSFVNANVGLSVGSRGIEVIVVNDGWR